MIPFEKVVDMLRNLPQEDYESAAGYISMLATRHHNPGNPLSRAQILEDLAISREQEKEGKYKPAGAAFDEVMAENGLYRH